MHFMQTFLNASGTSGGLTALIFGLHKNDMHFTLTFLDASWAREVSQLVSRVPSPQSVSRLPTLKLCLPPGSLTTLICCLHINELHFALTLLAAS